MSYKKMHFKIPSKKSVVQIEVKIGTGTDRVAEEISIMFKGAEVEEISRTEYKRKLKEYEG